MKENISVIIPCYNEEQGIRSTIEALLPVCRDYQWQIIVVNDASTDRTADILESFGNDITVLHHPVNKGYGGALKTGIHHAQTPYVAFYDADGQHRPEDLLNMAAKMGAHDMLVGQRGKDSHQDWVRKPGKWVLGKVANFLAGRKIPDLNSGLRILVRHKVEKLLHLFPEGFSFSTTSTIAFMHLGYSVGYYPIKVNKRVGNSMVKQLQHGSQTILLILRLIVLFNPLKVFIPVSLVFILLGILYEIIYGILIIFPDVKLLAGAFFLIISGILIFFFGLLADQISALRLHQTVK